MLTFLALAIFVAINLVFLAFLFFRYSRRGGDLEQKLTLIGCFFVLVGVICNNAVVKFNGGKMPVLVQKESFKKAVEDDPRHSNLTENSHLPFLADIFVLELEDESCIFYSIGDALILVGTAIVFLMVFLMVFSDIFL